MLSAGDIAPNELPRDDPLQYFVGALEDFEDFGVAVDLFEPEGLAGCGDLAGDPYPP